MFYGFGSEDQCKIMRFLTQLQNVYETYKAFLSSYSVLVSSLKLFCCWTLHSLTVNCTVCGKYVALVCLCRVISD